MTASQISRLETNKDTLLSVMRNLMELSVEDGDHNEALIWAAAQIRRACERLDEVE